MRLPRRSLSELRHCDTVFSESRASSRVFSPKKKVSKLLSSSDDPAGSQAGMTEHLVEDTSMTDTCALAAGAQGLCSPGGLRDCNDGEVEVQTSFGDQLVALSSYYDQAS